MLILITKQIHGFPFLSGIGKGCNNPISKEYEGVRPLVLRETERYTMPSKVKFGEKVTKIEKA